jgi:hypothetical protein
VLLDFKPPIRPPLVGILDPITVQAYYEVNIDFRITLGWIGRVDKNEMSDLGKPVHYYPNGIMLSGSGENLQ